MSLSSEVALEQKQLQEARAASEAEFNKLPFPKKREIHYLEDVLEKAE